MSSIPQGKDAGRAPRSILVAGDVCLDVVATPIPGTSGRSGVDNWRITGETRTHFLPGGAMLLAKFARHARQARQKAGGSVSESSLDSEIAGPCPIGPADIRGLERSPLRVDSFLKIAERLRRDEIVHSLLSVCAHPTTADPKDKSKTLRVAATHGYSGPQSGDPTLTIAYPDDDGRAEIVVLDDTGNPFRRRVSADEAGANPWPKALGKDSRLEPLVIYKLHRPLPGTSENPLWNAVAAVQPHGRVVILSVDDLRCEGAAISLGLSWERTALDVVWHLLQPRFAVLRDCPHLVVRLGLDGALLWLKERSDEGDVLYRAWLVYDPAGIEGRHAQRTPGHMVSCGSAFCAALAEQLSVAEPDPFALLLAPPGGRKPGSAHEDLLLEAIEAGLRAARRLLDLGFGADPAQPRYPEAELFRVATGAGTFARQRVQLLPAAVEPDRAHWRLVDSIFEGRTQDLHRAVEMVATRRETARTQPESDALALLNQVPVASFGQLTTRDRKEIEHFRSLHALMRDYLRSSASRPLSVAVFGPPGAGKTFGVKQVAASLADEVGVKRVVPLTFNLALYQTQEELASAFHLVRDVALTGKVPLVFFDEFDTALGGNALAWLRFFLAPMQDGEFLDRGAPHPIGQSIFVFAGGTSATFEEFGRHVGMEDSEFRSAKGPDFLSRLRATLDIPSLDFPSARAPLVTKDGGRVQPPHTFDPYGPISAFPCESSILLRRAQILAFNLGEKAPYLIGADRALDVAPAVLRALLRLPRFVHGNRSFEAILDMSHLAGASTFTPSLLPPPFQLSQHADPVHFEQLVGTDYPFPPADRELIARAIHEHYREMKRRDPGHDPESPSLREWDGLDRGLQESSYGQADDIATKLRSVGLWFRKSVPGAARSPDGSTKIIAERRDELARAEHDRWAAQKRRQGWIATAEPGHPKDNALMLHDCLFPWQRLTDEQKKLDLEFVSALPHLLGAAAYEIVEA